MTKRAFRELADGDALASHVAHDIDIYCSADIGNSNARNSILDSAHRARLSTTYGVRLMTFDDRLTELP
jgi:hypothetical protein